jgi:hypothetical protein
MTALRPVRSRAGRTVFHVSFSRTPSSEQKSLIRKMSITAAGSSELVLAGVGASCIALITPTASEVALREIYLFRPPLRLAHAPAREGDPKMWVLPRLRGLLG